MVREIDEYREEQARKEAERKKLDSWFAIASEVFQEPLYKITPNEAFDSGFHVHFQTPNELHSKSKELLQRTAAADDIKRYNSIAQKCNFFGGFHSVVNLYPLRDSIDAMCQEVYQDARRLAEELEKRLGGEVSLTTKYPRVAS